MKKHLLFIPLLLLVNIFHALAQNDVAMQTAEGSLMAKNYTSAENNFTKYIASFSSQIPAYMQKVKTYDTCGVFQKNFLFPNFTYEHQWALAYCERGMARLGLNSTDSARADFIMAAKLDERYAEPNYQMGALLKAAGDKINACIYTGKALMLSDTMRKAKDLYTMNFCWMCAAEYFTKGKNSVDLKEYKEALPNLNLAVLLSPDSATYYAYRGAAYDGLGKPDSALMDYTSALKLDSSSYQAYYRRALMFETKQKYQEAFNDLTKAINMNSNFADAYKHRAEDAENMNKDASAQYDYKQLIRLKPGDGEAYYKVALFMHNAGQDACDYFQKALDRGVDDAQGYVDDCKKEAEKEARSRLR